jgi:biopolymer transport protein ExbD
VNFRARSTPAVFGFQIAPMVDILLVLLVFFIVTWNFAIQENELEVKVPEASQSSESKPYVNQVVLNIKPDGTVVLNRKTLSADELREKLTQLASLYPDQAVIVRGDQNVPYRFIVDVLDICRMANIWNIVFATAKPE